jgi:hypothetical protein
MKQIFNIVTLGDKLFERGNCRVDLVFVQLDERDALLFETILDLALLDDVFVVRKILLDWLNFLNIGLLFCLFRVLLLLLNFLAHC